MKALQMFAYGVLITFGAAMLFRQSTSLRDFGSFYASGEGAAAGFNPYNIYPLTFFISTPNGRGYNINLNPPTLLPLFDLLSDLPPLVAFRFWSLVSIASGAVLLSLLLRMYRDEIDAPRAALWFLALGAIWDTLYLGQIYLPLALLSAGAWFLLREKRDIAAGVLIGLLAAFKPNFLVWPALMLLAGYYRVTAASAVAGLVAVAIPALLYGPDVYAQWLSMIGTDTSRAAFPTNGSIVGLFAKVGVPVVGQAIAAALLIASAVLVWIKRPPPLVTSSVALAVSLIASPIAWVHYSLFVLPVLFAHWNSKSPVVALSMAALVVPPVLLAATPMSSLWLVLTLGNVYTWAFLGVGYLAFRDINYIRR